MTGASRGIGFEVAKGLARLGASVGLLCRVEEEGRRAAGRIREELPTADLQCIECDLSSLRSVRAAAAAIRSRWSRVDVLVNNAGAIFEQRQLTPDGCESTLAVGALGPFLLTSLLRDRLEAAAARVVNLTGIYQRRGRIVLEDLHFERRRYGWLEANNQAQRARLLFTSELARRAPGLLVVSVHPGAVRTEAQRRLRWPVRLLLWTLLRPGFVRAELGALPVVRLAADPALVQKDVSGRFVDRFRVAADSPDPSLAEAFWRCCEALCATPP